MLYFCSVPFIPFRILSNHLSVFPNRITPFTSHQHVPATYSLFELVGRYVPPYCKKYANAYCVSFCNFDRFSEIQTITMLYIPLIFRLLIKKTKLVNSEN